MKVQHADSHVKGSRGITESKGFAIRTNAHAYKMLSSGLYSNKIGAVLREIGCNAADAHIEAGTPDLPIEVKIPNRIDGQFYIKDWGPGLSHEDVMNLYTTYFASTKQSSNDYTGAFGLGSKSPFSYTDSFTVTSVHGGKKRTYSAHIGDEGVPTIALLTQEEAGADWKHGMMIGFPVKPDDYAQFASQAQSIYQFFRVPPKILGMQRVTKLEVDYDSATFAKIKGHSGHGVVMGNVCYPLHLQHIQGLTPLGVHMFGFYGIYLKADIGDVQVAASREELQYDKDTIAFLKMRCEDAAKEIAAEIGAAVRKFSSADWKTKCATKEMTQRWYSGYYNWEPLLSAVGDTAAASIASTIYERTVKMPTWAGSKSSFRIMVPAGNKVSHQVVKGGETGPSDYRHAAQVSLESASAIYTGAAPHAMMRARHAIASGALKQIILITPDFVRKTTEAEARDEAKRLEKLLSGIPVEDIAKLPMPPNWTPAKKGAGAKRAKGAVLPPLPARPVDIYGDPNTHSVRRDVAAWAATSDLTYMVRTAQSGIRVFEKSEDADVKFDWRTWHGGMWRAYYALREHLKLAGPTSYALVDATTVRTLALPQRGWRPTHTVLAEWLADQATRDAIAAKAAKWRPTVSLAQYGRCGWVESLVLLRHKDPALYAASRAALPADVADAVDDIHQASVDAGPGNAGQKQPVVVGLFNELQRFFGLQPLGAVGARTYLSPDDLEASILKKYPSLALFDADVVGKMQSAHPKRLRGFLELVFN